MLGLNYLLRRLSLLNYIRLLKAAAIGPEFYKIYVLNKKAFNKTRDGTAAKEKYTDWGSDHPAISLYDDKKNYYRSNC